MGAGVHGGAPRKAGRPPKAVEPAAPAEPPFVWDRDGVEMVLGGLFDWPYALLGASHRHWLEAKEKAKTAYDKLAWGFNKLGFQSPVWAIVFTSATHVAFQLLYAGAKSWSIVKEERAQAEREKKKTEAPKADALPESVAK